MAKPGLRSTAPPADTLICASPAYLASDHTNSSKDAALSGEASYQVSPQDAHGINDRPDERLLNHFEPQSAERQGVLADLAQSQSLNHKQGERIVQLERAIDQLMTSLAEMELQVQEKQFLEEQLVATEETANIQQQAIAMLKRQLTDGTSLLEQPSDSNDLSSPPSQPATAKADRTLSNRLMGRKKAGGQEEKALTKLQAELAATEAKIAQLEAQETEQSMVRALLQQSCREVEVERDRNSTRLESLEQQTAEMQEQILQQAKQASEYEAAVQYWRDRYTSSQRYASRLKTVLERVLPEHPANLVDILTTLQLSPSDISSPADPPASPPTDPRNLKVDLPAFLGRQQ